MASKKISARIIGTGSYLPPKIVTNHNLAKIVKTDHDWIVERTGIEQRHIAETETTSDMSVKAAQAALENANIKASQIDAVIMATTTPDLTFPSTASDVAAKLDCGTAPAFDIQAVCTGFVYALHTADLYIASGKYQRIIVIGADRLSNIVDWTDRNTCILFGDGAGAVVLEAANTGILASSIYSDGSTRELLRTTEGAGSSKQSGVITMAGSEVFKHAVSKLAACTLEALQQAGKTAQDVDWVIPHQANQRILSATIRKLKLPENKLISTVAKHANTSAASIPLALDVAARDGRLKTGQLLAIQAIGGGLTWGSVIIEY